MTSSDLAAVTNGVAAGLSLAADGQPIRGNVDWYGPMDFLSGAVVPAVDTRLIAVTARPARLRWDGPTTAAWPRGPRGGPLGSHGPADELPVHNPTQVWYPCE